ncbi:MAG: sigma-70 family RNA polymerase sigma factor [Rhizobacter sp.]|nr:sigma-70 family RNA polymerase sigma factor [Chlorobiales bacterium]
MESTTTSETNIEAAIVRAQGGSSAAFAEVYHEYASRIYALALRMLADRTRAEELTQDVFVRAWQNLKSFRGESAFGTWLHRLAVNVILMELRSERRREARIETTETLDDFSDKVSSNRAEPIDLEQAIASLPTNARTVFVLHDVEGYLHHEIAGLCGITAGTSKAQLHRARGLLREALRK